MKENPDVPRNRRWHSFLLNKENQIFFVGDPVVSEQMFNAFELAVDSTEPAITGTNVKIT